MLWNLIFLNVSLSLSQVRLNPAEGSDVLKRWAEHLCSPQVNLKSKAILVLLSLGCFQKVGEMLHRWALLFLLDFFLFIPLSVSSFIHVVL